MNILNKNTDEIDYEIVEEERRKTVKLIQESECVEIRFYKKSTDFLNNHKKENNEDYVMIAELGRDPQLSQYKNAIINIWKE